MKTVNFIAIVAALVYVGAASPVNKSQNQPKMMTQAELNKAMNAMSLQNNKKTIVPISGVKSTGIYNPDQPGSLNEAMRPGRKTQINMGNTTVFTKFDGQKPVIIAKPGKSRL